MIFSWLKNRRRRKLLARPFPETWLEHLRTNVDHYGRLPSDAQQKLSDKTVIFVAEKHWTGCGGLEMTDEIKVTIAAQACVLLLGIEGDYLFDGIFSILVYPAAYAPPPEERDGLVDLDVTHLGEAWHRGPVVLSWRHVLAGSRGHDDGQNLVIHEFAHQLDGLDGTPPLGSRQQYRDWQAVTDREYRRLVRQASEGAVTLLDDYGASSRAEFFAVASECFFQKPREMLARHPDLFELLRSFYKQDPTTWAW